jgi:2-C-methyl-D-erythritol 2,4-cyclodiphosphate synthase
MGASGVAPGEAQPAAEARTAGETRTGFSTDAHPFGPEQGLWLGGVEIAAAPRLHGHSDGDAALHAVAGALLGAAGLGDLGSVYPADGRTRRGIASGELLRGVVAQLEGSGWRPASVDLTILAGRPRLGAHLPAMRAAIAKLLGLGVEAVNVKGSTGNLSGDAGAGRVIAAHAVATVRRLGSAT